MVEIVPAGSGGETRGTAPHTHLLQAPPRNSRQPPAILGWKRKL